MKAISTAFFILWANIAFAAEPYTFTTISVPGAVSTVAFGINDLGDTVGVFYESFFGQPQAFLFSDGKYYDLAVSGALRTIPFGINRDGVIAGTFINNGQFAFLMDEINTTVLDQAVRADAINNRGVAVGYQMSDPTGQYHYQYGYIWQNGQYITPVTIKEIPGILGSALTGVNDRGDTVGYYFYDTGPCCSNQVTQGFMRTKAGKLTPLELLPLGINGAGVIVGYSGAGNDAAVYEDGVTTLIKIPGADYVQVHGINNKGALVGYYTKAGVQYGFVGKPEPRRDLRLKLPNSLTPK